MTFTKRRTIGATLAALTVVAGLSSVAFAGEPDSLSKQDGMMTVSFKAVPCTEAMVLSEEEQQKIADGTWVPMEKLVFKLNADAGKADGKATMMTLVPSIDKSAELNSTDMIELVPAGQMDEKIPAAEIISGNTVEASIPASVVVPAEEK